MQLTELGFFSGRQSRQMAHVHDEEGGDAIGSLVETAVIVSTDGRGGEEFVPVGVCGSTSGVGTVVVATVGVGTTT